MEFWMHGYSKKVFPLGHFKYPEGGNEEGFYEKNKHIEDQTTIETYDIEISFRAKVIQWEDYIIEYEEEEKSPYI